MAVAYTQLRFSWKGKNLRLTHRVSNNGDMTRWTDMTTTRTNKNSEKRPGHFSYRLHYPVVVFAKSLMFLVWLQENSHYSML